MRFNNACWEKRLGISTRGTVEVDHFDSARYAALSYSLIWRILDHLALGPSDTFVDIGSGKGRVLCCAARYRVGQVLGMDLSESFCAAARDNARQMRGRKAPIFVQTSTADAFDYSSASVLFFFNPFGEATMAPLLAKIGREVTREVRVAYAQPTHDDVFQQQPWVEQTEYWDASERQPAVSFYQSR
jgi:cyclopropane fatty-acyl-phospholipid synthase-like methyltransferase